MNIVVLAGGLSPERDVSLATGTMVTNALRHKGHNAVLVDLFFGPGPLPENPTDAFCFEGMLPAYAVPEIAPDLSAVRARRKSGFSAEIGENVLELCRAADMTFLALHGGVGEDGSLQSFFDLSGIRYTGNSAFGCALAMNKDVSKSIFRSSGIPTPAWTIVHRDREIDLAALPIPCVVKPNSGGSSIGVVIVRDRDALSAALREGFRLEDRLIVEEYVEGIELSAGVLGGCSPTVFPLIEIVPKHGFYDYQHKYQPGWTDEIVPARIPPEQTRMVQACAAEAFSALRLEVYARIDLLLSRDGNMHFLEANTLPGMTQTSLLPQMAAAYGLDYASLCEEIVSRSLARYEAE